MSDDPKVLPFQNKTLTPGPGGRTITVSYDHLVLLFDAFETTATDLQSKLELLAEFYGMLPGHDEVGKRKSAQWVQGRAAERGAGTCGSSGYACCGRTECQLTWVPSTRRIRSVGHNLIGTAVAIALLGFSGAPIWTRIDAWALGVASWAGCYGTGTRSVSS